MNLRKFAILLALNIFILFVGCSTIVNLTGTVPTVTGTVPQNGSQDVDPSLTEVRVSFSKPMMDKSWSWCWEDKTAFPEMTDSPRYTNDGITNILPVKLEANKEYIIWINMEKFTSFKDKSGLSVKPYRLTFKTRN
ncbi:Ig-like domain-containing protein [Candidatus Latescibacterota bacterium]